MFRDTRRKKLKNRVIFTAIGVFVLGFGIWLNFQGNDKDEQPAEDTIKKVEVQQTESDKVSETKDKNGKDGTDTENRPETYLIKEVEGVVKVFVCDEDGNKELYLITSIPFDLLSESDQQLFVDGVTIETEEDLGEFLQNFDS